MTRRQVQAAVRGGLSERLPMLVGVVMVLGLVYLGYGAFEMVFRWIGHVFGDVIYKVFGLFFGWFIT